MQHNTRRNGTTPSVELSRQHKTWTARKHNVEHGLHLHVQAVGTRFHWEFVGDNQSTCATTVQLTKYVIPDLKGNNDHRTLLSLLVTYEPQLLSSPDLKNSTALQYIIERGSQVADETEEKPVNSPVSSSLSPLFQRKNRDDLYVAHRSSSAWLWRRCHELGIKSVTWCNRGRLTFKVGLQRFCFKSSIDF